MEARGAPEIQGMLYLVTFCHMPEAVNLYILVQCAEEYSYLCTSCY